MMQLRAAEARGKANFGWLDARHSFSFGHYYDPEWMGHSVLRVINQDLVAPGGVPNSFGSIQICNRERGSVCEGLYSLWRIPLPALISWKSPAGICSA